MFEVTWGDRRSEVNADSLPKSNRVEKSQIFRVSPRTPAGLGEPELRQRGRSGFHPPGGVLEFRHGLSGFPKEQIAETGTYPWPLGALILPVPRVLSQNVYAPSEHTKELKALPWTSMLPSLTHPFQNVPPH